MFQWLVQLVLLNFSDLNCITNARTTKYNLNNSSWTKTSDHVEVIMPPVKVHPDVKLTPVSHGYWVKTIRGECRNCFMHSNTESTVHTKNWKTEEEAGHKTRQVGQRASIKHLSFQQISLLLFPQQHSVFQRWKPELQGLVNGQ